MDEMDTGSKILEASLELFSRNGFSSTTTRSIADRAGVNELTIFRKFGTKENLLSEVIDHSFDPSGMREHIPDELTGDPAEDLLRIIGAVRENLRERELLFRLMLREVASNKIVARKLHSFPQIMKGFMVQRIEGALQGKVRGDHDIETASVFLASYFIRSEMMRILLGNDPFHEIDKDRTREVIDIFLHGVLKEGA